MQFNNIQVTVGTKNIMAINASVSEQNNIAPIYFLGSKRGSLYSPSGPLNNQVQINYILEPENDINHSLMNQIRNYDLSSFPIRVIIGGITGAAYLNNYTLNVQTNDVVSATVTYNIYTPFSGKLSNQPFGTNYNNGRGSGIAHSWTTYPKMANHSSTGSILDLNYSFSANFQPIYKIGNPNPIEVKFLSAEENFSITSEYDSNNITYSGKNFTDVFNDIEIVEINALSGLWTNDAAKLFLYLNSGKLISNRINIAENEIIVQESNIIKHY